MLSQPQSPDTIGLIVLAVLLALGFIAAISPLLLALLVQLKEDEDRKKNSTGGRNYVEY